MDEEEYDVSAKFRLVVGESFSAGKTFHQRPLQPTITLISPLQSQTIQCRA
jgi:hypothetical protein